MGEGYGCSSKCNYTVAGGMPLCPFFYIRYVLFFTSDKEAFLYIRLTPIFNRQVTKDCTQQLGHHACFTCEVNGRSLTCVLYMHIFL